MRDENEWRRQADQEAAYYDGNQLTPQDRMRMEELGIAPLTRNLIAPAINLVLGMEAKNRRDWKTTPEDEASTEVAAALNQELKKQERASGADVAIAKAYADQVKVGLGWVEVVWESDPFKPAYRVAHVPRSEMKWDWRDRTWDLSTARYLIREKWYDADLLERMFPKYKKLINTVARERADWDTIVENFDGDLEMSMAVEAETQTTLREQEWRDSERKRLLLYEVWYRVYHEGLVLKMDSGQVMEYEPNSLGHSIAVMSGRGELIRARFGKVRRAWYLGPHYLFDEPSPFPHNRFPYIPFWGFVEDRTNIPYGLIRNMMGPQEEVNKRLQKMMWILSAKRVTMDSDALDMRYDDMLEEIARPDAVVTLNPHRKNKTRDAFMVDQDFALSQQQFDVMKDAQNAIKDASGVYSALMGDVDPSRTSGVSLNSIIEQGATTLAFLNANYARSRMLTGELLLALIRHDMKTQERSFENVPMPDGNTKTVQLNRRFINERGVPQMSNSIALSRLQVALEDVPETPSYRLQLFQQLSEIVKSMPPETQALFADFMIRLTDLPFAKEMAERLKQHLGIGQEADPQQQQAQAELQQLQQEQLRLSIEELRAKVDKLRAETGRLDAQAENLEANTDKTATETALMDTKQAAALAGQEFDMAFKSRQLAQQAEQAKQQAKKPNTTSRKS